MLHDRSSLLRCFSLSSEIAGGILGVLLLLGRSGRGCQALLASDLAQLLWLPLSSVTGEKLLKQQDWLRVFHEALQLATLLLTKGRHEAVENR